MDELERQISQSTDDIYVNWNTVIGNWQVNLSSDRWHVGWWATTDMKCGAGGKFLDITIPPGSTILHAYLKLRARSSDSSTGVKSRLHGEKNINPATFSNYANYSARIRTGAAIDWDNIPTWTSGSLYQSPDIKDIIQEIVNLAGWTSGNPIVIFWDDHEGRTATGTARLRRGRSFDHAIKTPPILYAQYEAPPPVVGRSFGYITG